MPARRTASLSRYGNEVAIVPSQALPSAQNLSPPATEQLRSDRVVNRCEHNGSAVEDTRSSASAREEGTTTPHMPTPWWCRRPARWPQLFPPATSRPGSWKPEPGCGHRATARRAPRRSEPPAPRPRSRPTTHLGGDRTCPDGVWWCIVEPAEDSRGCRGDGRLVLAQSNDHRDAIAEEVVPSRWLSEMDIHGEAGPGRRAGSSCRAGHRLRPDGRGRRCPASRAPATGRCCRAGASVVIPDSKG